MKNLSEATPLELVRELRSRLSDKALELIVDGGMLFDPDDEKGNFRQGRRVDVEEWWAHLLTISDDEEGEEG